MIEANPAYLGDLAKRKAIVINKAVAAEDGVFKFIDAGLYGGIASTIDPVHSCYTANASEIKVPATTLVKILEEQNAPLTLTSFLLMLRAVRHPLLIKSAL